jgi:hypothetical protein
MYLSKVVKYEYSYRNELFKYEYSYQNTHTEWLSINIHAGTLMQSIYV